MLSHPFRRVCAGPIRVVLAAVLFFPLLAFGSLPGSAPSGVAVAAGTVPVLAGRRCRAWLLICMRGRRMRC